MIINRVSLKNERGSVAIFAVVALLLLSTFGFIAVSITSNDMKNTMQAIDSTQGEYIANGTLLRVLDSYNGIVPKTQTLKNIHTDNNGNVYSAEVVVEGLSVLTDRKITVVALKNAKKIYSISAEVSFFTTTSGLITHGYSINSVVQNPL